MISMKLNSTAPRAFRLLAALIPLATFAFAADPAKPQDNAAPTPEAPLHEIGAPSDATVTPTPTPTPDPDPEAYPQRGRFDRHAPDGRRREPRLHQRLDLCRAGREHSRQRRRGHAARSRSTGPSTATAWPIMGTNTINGTVHGNVVAVLGGIKLGPHAHVDGNVVAVVGTVSRAPGAYVGGHIVKQGGGVDFSDDSGAYSWWQHAARKGPPHRLRPAPARLLAPQHLHDRAVRPPRPGLPGRRDQVRRHARASARHHGPHGHPRHHRAAGGLHPSPHHGRRDPDSLRGPSDRRRAPRSCSARRRCTPSSAARCSASRPIPRWPRSWAPSSWCSSCLSPSSGACIWIVLAFLGYACALTTLFTPKRTVAARRCASGRHPAWRAPCRPRSAVPPAAMGLVTASPEAAAAPAQPAMPADQVPLFVPTPLVPPLLARVSEAALPKAGFWIRIVALMIDVILDRHRDQHARLVPGGRWRPMAPSSGS